MTRYPLTVAAALALILQLAGCETAPAPVEPPAPVKTPAAATPTAMIVPAPLPSASIAPIADPERKVAGKLPGPTDRDPAHALAYWRAAMEGRDWAAARSVFGDFGAQSGQSARAFAAAWDKYRIVDVTVGAGEQDGAAGSSYYEVPVTITGLTRADKPYHLAGRLTLRRVNDVDGATPEQLRWHIERSTLQP